MPTSKLIHAAEQIEAERPYASTYFGLEDHRALIFGHVVLMVIAWALVLPVAVMLSLARYRHKSYAQLAFLVANAVGLLLGVIYNSGTQDLFPGNAHHPLGWVVTWLAGLQFMIGWFGPASQKSSSSRWRTSQLTEQQALLPLPLDALEEQAYNGNHLAKQYRLSSDSGHGTASYTGSPAARSEASLPSPSITSDTGDDCLPASRDQTPWHSRARYLPKGLLSRVRKPVLFYYNLIDRTLLVLGFIALCTGIITFGRLFEGEGMLNGFAHWIKGGVFVWLGIVTLGRWCGAFGDIGWAWNKRPETSRNWRPSAEFVESALIAFYGVTNVFLEHLSAWGDKWEQKDLEHVAITVLFMGGGMCGMLVESRKLRELLNATVPDATQARADRLDASVEEEKGKKDSDQSQQGPSLNPMPALIILLLGVLMSSHSQDSMLSSMVHKQWGTLLTGAAFARALTYVLVYLAPPRSVYPSRPPTELLASFGLMAGGVVLMASSTDTILAMESRELDATVFYTITMGFVGLVMAWVMALMGLKGWAAREEGRRQTRV